MDGRRVDGEGGIQKSSLSYMSWVHRGMEGERMTSANRGAYALLDALHDGVEGALDVVEVGGSVLVRAVRAGGDVEGE